MDTAVVDVLLVLSWSPPWFGPSFRTFTAAQVAKIQLRCLKKRRQVGYMVRSPSQKRRFVMPPRHSVSVSKPMIIVERRKPRVWS